MIVPRASAPGLEALRKLKARKDWLKRQNWLLIEEATVTGQRLRAWMESGGWTVEAAMQLDSFDLIINLVSVGMGVGFVPIRALALYNQKRTIQRVSLPERFERELVVAVRKSRSLPEHIERFIGNVLFR